jgi:hypothetical protein
MLDFDEDAHKFTVTPQSPQLAIEFGPKLFFTSLTTGLPAEALERSLAAGVAAFNNFLVFPAPLFDAEAVALVPRGAEARFRGNFEFGFVQGTTFPSVHLEYWGKTREEGRSIVHIQMPLTFEVDTDPITQPWTRVASGRFKVTNLTSTAAGPLRLKVEASFADHPMIVMPHTIGTPPQQRFLRWVKYNRDFRTIFAVRDKSTRSFDAISATRWRVPFDHLIRYISGSPTVDNRVGPPNFPRGGTPSDIQAADRDILRMATSGGPFVTVATLNARLHDPTFRTETDETPNADFDRSFWT